MKKSNEKILEGILEKCNWYEKIIVKMNKKLILNIYHLGRINSVNKLL